ncbi:MAG: hypothetical protein AAB446_03095 [Patescibacteria group bacterium]
MQKALKIFLNTIPVLIMIGLIPFVQNDYILTVFHIAIIYISLQFIKYERSDSTVLVFGFFIMTFFEYVFVTTGVESFTRNSLFGVMPVWLPFLWSYGFLAIKKSAQILDRN